MWSTGKKEVHLLRATRTTQTWQRPPALPYAHLRAHLQKSPASCSVFVPGWIKPIGSTRRCVSGCVCTQLPPQPPDTILLVFLGGTSDQMSKSPLVVLWFMKKNGTRLCAGWSNCSFGFKPLSLYAVREANMGFYAPLYMQYLYMYVQYVSFKSDSISLFSP